MQQVKCLKKQHNILSEEAESACNQLGAAQSEAAELRDSLNRITAHRTELSQANEQAMLQVIAIHVLVTSR